MGFDNVHEDVADLRGRVEKLEALFGAGKADAQAQAQAQADHLQAAMEAHEADTEHPAETHHDGEVTSHDAQDGHVSGQE